MDVTYFGLIFTGGASGHPAWKPEGFTSGKFNWGLVANNNSRKIERRRLVPIIPFKTGALSSNSHV